MRSLLFAALMALVSVPAETRAQTTCDISAQQGGSFIGGGTTPFTVQSTGKANCKGFNKPDTTSQLEFGAQTGCNTAHCAGANNCEYPLSNGSFVMTQSNSGSPAGTPTTTISGTFDSGFVCFDFSTEGSPPDVTGTTVTSTFNATVVGGTGSWAGASGGFVVTGTGQVLKGFGSGIVQVAFTAALNGTIQHP